VDMHLQKVALKEPVRRAAPRRTGKCLACGTDKMNGGRRYCSKECRQHILWVLSLSKGLLRTFNARYAAFSFTGNYVVLDILPVWTKGISRFVWPRTQGRKPALDLKELILESGREWHDMVDHRNSGSLASLRLLQRSHEARLDPESIKPGKHSRPRLSKQERDSLKVLKIGKEILSIENCTSRIRGAYKRLAKRYHPDVGGDAEAFRRLNDAHEQMLLWVENPQYTCRRALLNSWSYDSAVNRWSPPL
jgi:hypothetical protein